MNLIPYKQEIEDFVFTNANKIINENKYDYTTFGKEIEPILSFCLRKYFANFHNIDDSNFYDAPDKNYFPDLTLFDNIAIEFKSAINTAQPENDMGTLNSWGKKIKKFGDNIYYVFVKYSINGNLAQIENIYFDKVYNFIGINSDGLLRYREKDGNLRPKSWNDFENDISYCNSLEGFIEGLEHSRSYRAYRLVEKHLKDVTDQDFTKLKNKYFN